MNWVKEHLISETQNNEVAIDSISQSIAEDQGIEKQIIGVSSSDGKIYFTFISELIAIEQTALSIIVTAHDGIPLEEPVIVQPVEISKEIAFASKKIDINGVEKSLFKRVHGLRSASIPAGVTGYLELTVPYPQAKFSGAEIFGTDHLDTLDFLILDTPTNTYSGAPVETYGANFPLNQFGFDVEMPARGDYANTSNYDADLYYGMIVMCVYKNNSAEAKIISGNFWLHEVK